MTNDDSKINAPFLSPTYMGRDGLDALVKPDIFAIRQAFNEGSLAEFRETSSKLVNQWRGKNQGTDIYLDGYAKILKATADTFAKALCYDEAQQHYDQALEVTPDNASLYISKAECYMASAKINAALDCFEKALTMRSDVHTAAKYAEVLFLTERPKYSISEVIEPFKWTCISKPIPSRSEAVILALGFVIADKSEHGEKYGYIQGNNRFNNFEMVMDKIQELAMHFFKYERRSPFLSSKGGGAGKENPEQIISKAYAESKDIWNGESKTLSSLELKL